MQLPYTFQGLTFSEFDGVKIAVTPAEQSGPVCHYWQETRPADYPPGASWDSWRFTLPRFDGCPESVLCGTFSHPTEYGCKIAIRRFFIESGVIQVPAGNSHLSEVDSAILAETIAARAKLDQSRPLVGDLVRFPDGRLKRCCNETPWGMQTAPGGSYYIGRSGLSSMSGSLDKSQLWEFFQPTEETQAARFWFFSEGMAGAGRGVAVMIPVPVWRLELRPYSEAEAREHPKANDMAEFWGEGSRDHLQAIHDLMNPRAD